MIRRTNNNPTTANVHSIAMSTGPVIHKGTSKIDSNIGPVLVARRLATAGMRDTLVRQPHLHSGFPPRVVSVNCVRRCRWLQFDSHLFDPTVEFEGHGITCT